MSDRANRGELQTIAAARRLARAHSVFIGVGRPSTAALLARMVHNPDLVLVYESGTVGAKPRQIPLSIGDGELAQTADFVVSVPEMFNYWIGAGRIDVAFLGAAQVDRHANLNSTVIGDYEHPKAWSRRCPGDSGGLRRGDRDRPPHAPHVRRATRFLHHRRTRRRTRGAGAARLPRLGADRGHHRSRRTLA